MKTILVVTPELIALLVKVGVVLIGTLALTVLIMLSNC